MGKKTRDLAALAGLAGLAYAYNKSKGDSSKTDTGDETDRLKARKPAEDEPRRKIEDYQKKAPEDEKGSAQSDVLKAVTAPKAASNDKAGNQGVIPPKSSTEVKPKPAPELKTITTRKGPRDAEAGTSRGQRSFTSRSSGDEMSKAAKNYKAPAPTTSSKVADTVKTVAKTVAQGPAAAAKEPAEKAANAMRETYRDLSGKVQYKTPDIPSAAKTASDAVASGAKKVGSGIADYANRTFTLEGREKAKKEADDARAKAASSREYDEDALSKGSALRRGGMTKMASGGMVASRRGDGIAQRGKTRGKMC